MRGLKGIWCEDSKAFDARDQRHLVRARIQRHLMYGMKGICCAGSKAFGRSIQGHLVRLVKRAFGAIDSRAFGAQVSRSFGARDQRHLV